MTVPCSAHIAKHLLFIAALALTSAFKPPEKRSNAITESLYILQEEETCARNQCYQPNSSGGASRRQNSFLMSSPEIKRMSSCALFSELVLQKCYFRISLNSALACSRYWDLVHRGWACPELMTELREAQDAELCYPDQCPRTVPMCYASHRNFRTIDGSCNNLKSPLTGTPNRPYQRYLPADYSDCVTAPREGSSGPLPSAREISNVIYQSDMQPTSTVVTMLHMTYGQLIDHDTDRTPVSKLRRPDTGELVDVDCGTDGCKVNNAEARNCFPIPIPGNDPLFPSKTCMKFIRSEQVMAPDCKPDARQQANAITSWLDASFVYDSSPIAANKLRSFISGKLRDIPHPLNPDGFKPLLPTQFDPSCRNTSNEIQCFLTGDVRQNEQVGLMALHVVFMRYHNYIAENLQRRHPLWDDETLYQMSRRILGAVWQNTIYKEYLPAVLGPQIMQACHLNPSTNTRNPYFTEYTDRLDEVNPDTANAFATAAFRFGHSQITDHLRFSDPSFNHQEDVFFTELFFNPARIYRSGILNNTISGVNAVLIGQTVQPAAAADVSFTQQVAGHLFTDLPPRGSGLDLPAINTQRGRDHGLPGYTLWNKLCNAEFKNMKLRDLAVELPRSFNDLVGRIPLDKINKLKAIYSSVDDIDLFTGAMLEEHVQGGLVGPTFACIIAKQFHDYKFGDRFYYESSDSHVRFTKDQLANIKQQTIASILCVTLEDDPGNAALEVSFQKHVLLQTLTEAEASLSDVKITKEERNAKLDIYDGQTNERRPCIYHSKLDFDLFE